MLFDNAYNALHAAVHAADPTIIIPKFYGNKILFKLKIIKQQPGQSNSIPTIIMPQKNFTPSLSSNNSHFCFACNVLRAFTNTL